MYYPLVPEKFGLIKPSHAPRLRHGSECRKAHRPLSGSTFLLRRRRQRARVVNGLHFSPNHFGSAEQIPRRARHSSLRHVHFGVTALFRAGAVTFMRMQTGTCGQMLEITRPFASRPFRSRRVPEMTCIRPSEVARVAVPKTVCNRLHRTPFTQLLLGRHHLDRVKIRVRTLLKLLLEKTVKCRR